MDVNAYVIAKAVGGVSSRTMAKGWENLKESTAFLSILSVLESK